MYMCTAGSSRGDDGGGGGKGEASGPGDCQFKEGGEAPDDNFEGMCPSPHTAISMPLLPKNVCSTAWYDVPTCISTQVKRHHMYIHTVEITSQCPTCHKGFTRVDMYWKYLKLTE